MKIYLALMLPYFALSSCQQQNDKSQIIEHDISQTEGWIDLLDPQLSQWDSYLSYRMKPGYDGSKPDQNPIGLNKPEAQNIFSVTKDGSDEILRISGEIYGAITSKAEYENYHLKLKVKWGEKKWDPRKDLLKDSGILYHAIGEHGAEYWRSWMLSQELQIMEGHMGDYWNQATSAIDIRAYTPEYIMNPIASTTQPFLSVGHKQDIKGLVIRSDNHESPNGEWTDIELITHNGKSLHIVNGNIVMVLKNSRYEKDGEFLPLTKGRIQIQSEGAEVYYKDIKIKEIDALSKEHAQYFIDK